MGIAKLRQLVCKDCGDLDPKNEDIVETAGFQHNTYIESIKEIFSNNGMNQKENSGKKVENSIKLLTDIFTDDKMSKKSKKKQLDKEVVCDLLNDIGKKLRSFKSDLIEFIREVRKTACRVPTIKGPDDGERRAQEMLRDGKADWTNEQRNNVGLPQDPSMVLLGGKSSVKGSSSVAVSGSSSKSRVVVDLAPAAAAASSSDGASFSPGGMDASESQSKKSPVATKVSLCAFFIVSYISLLTLKMNGYFWSRSELLLTLNLLFTLSDTHSVIRSDTHFVTLSDTHSDTPLVQATTAPSTKPSTFKPGDLKESVAHFNRTVTELDPL